MNLGNRFPVPQESGSMHPLDHWTILSTSENLVPNADPRSHGNEGLIYIGDPLTPMSDEMQRSIVNHGEMRGLQGRISADNPSPDEVYGESWRDLLNFGNVAKAATPRAEAVVEFDHDNETFLVSGGYYQNLMKMSSNGSGGRVVPATSYHAATGNEYKEFQSPNSILEQIKALSSSQGITTSNETFDGAPIQSGIDSCGTGNCLEFAPETPDLGKQLINHQQSDAQSYSVGESLPPKKDNGVICTSSQEENPLNEHLGCITEIPASNSTLLKEHIVSQELGHGGIDLNKAPVQSAPRRRKHRPKVLREKTKKTPKPPVEGKPKRTPKPKNPDEKTQLKRKYVRRKGVTTSVPEPRDEASGSGVRRGLNFDLEASINDGNDIRRAANQHPPNLRPFDLNLESQEFDGVHDISAMQRPQSACSSVQQGKTVCNLSGDSNQIFSVTPSLPSPVFSTTTASALNFETVPVRRSARNFVQAHADRSIHGVAPPLLVQTSTIVTKQRSKRNWQTSERINCPPANLMHSQTFQRTSFRPGFAPSQDTHGFRTGFAASALDSNKRKKFDNIPNTASVQDYTRPFGGSKMNSSSSYLGTQSNLRYSYSNSGNCGILSDRRTFTTTHANDFYDPRNITWLQYQRLKMLKNYLQGAEALNLNVSTRNETVTPVDLSVKRHTVKPASSIQPRSQNLHLNDYGKQLVCHDSSKKVKESKRGKNHAANITVDEIISRMEHLAIDASKEGRNAIVPYKERRNAIVPFTDTIKKSKTRPRVDLDPETTRLWNLLMGKADSESAEPMDDDKEKWWEEERKLLYGRVNAFISRMHQFQGDRRFTKWKGSVVDSVIGVFLTQNVSDHLSSSAYINLVAKFPAPQRKPNPTCSEYESISWVEEPDVQIIDPDGTITYHGRKVMQPHKKQSSETFNGSSEGRPGILNLGTVTHCENENSSSREEDVTSSQNSSESFCQSAKHMRSSPESGVEDHVTAYNSKKNSLFEGTQRTEEFTSLQQFHSQMMTGMLNDKSSMPGYEQPKDPASTSIFPAMFSGSNEHSYPVNSDSCCLQGSSLSSSLNKTSETGVNGSCCSAFSEHSLFSNSVEINKSYNANHTIKMNGGPVGYSAFAETEVPINHVRASSSFHQVDKSPAEPARLEEAAAKESGSSELLNKIGPDTKRKRNVAKEFDWDSLRRKVVAEHGIKERTSENMDTLDYEALRHADVDIISRTILERGMNNMLAERIKAFLNRLVEDHGSTDLEWLREVPPEQCKDYLLSIRGLGLKSVECVRLLTLHQVAFPVDTNVGRIAVRLGWVPLQPLPESLQLHLLELYPILESIQKHLWPRLCKLDQRSLYELHYQLITFGKVFCTKKNPNCNACPMRPECRHFASAFASARLALPAPGEKRVVNLTPPMATRDIPSTVVEPMRLLPSVNKTKGSPPKATRDIPPMVVEPMQLLPSFNNTKGSEVQISEGPCEPIIEEPASPEPELASPEALDSDIEDFYFEDPDEIPTINLNFEELKTNVENVIRGQNMGIQLGELSGALVALDASTASIPVPKLKNVSRLRTEHLVYELPDSHPLLKEMERREPDDPSPYLLVIWGPGNSNQPPEGCSRNHVTENNSETVKGTLLIPCRTAMRGSFPLNGTYFQVNEMFADHQSSNCPIDVPREWLWKLPRRTVYFGTSVTSIFRGLTQSGIQFCFWKGFVCVRGFDRGWRTPKPLNQGLHAIPNSKTKNKDTKEPKDKASKEPKNNKEPKSKGSKEPKNKEKKEPKNKEQKKGNGEESNRLM